MRGSNAISLTSIRRRSGKSVSTERTRNIKYVIALVRY